MSQRYSIEVVSDFVCPWCFIGTRRLEQVLAGKEADVTYRPFLLDPQHPHRGRRFAREPEAQIRSRPGDDVRARRRHRARGGYRRSISPRCAGTRRRSARTRSPATRQRRGRSGRSRTRSSRTTFSKVVTSARPTSSRTWPRPTGSTETRLRASWRTRRSSVGPRPKPAEMAAEGISGVPFFVFCGRFAVSGAQPTEVFEKALTHRHGVVVRSDRPSGVFNRAPVRGSFWPSTGKGVPHADPIRGSAFFFARRRHARPNPSKSIVDLGPASRRGRADRARPRRGRGLDRAEERERVDPPRVRREDRAARAPTSSSARTFPETFRRRSMWRT